jgi:hypothetical protein
MEQPINFGEAPLVDRYDSSLTSPRRPIPPIQQIKVAIEALQGDPSSVSLSMLEDIMMLVYLPEHLDILTGRIIPSCIAILEQSTKRNKVSHRLSWYAQN